MTLSLDGSFWGPWIIRVYVPEIESLREAILTHIIPALPNAEIEAEAYQQPKWDDAMSQLSDGNVDEGDLAEWALDRGIERYQRLTGVRQATRNMATVMLWHLLEQQMLCFHRRQVLTFEEEQIARNNPKVHKRLGTLQVFEGRMEKGGLGLDQITVWEEVSELRLVANTVKHGAGDSANRLHSLRPDLFSPPNIKEFVGSFPSSPHNVERPAAGDDLYVADQDLVDYFDAALAFWSEFTELIQG